MKNVLLIEDDRDLRKLLRVALEAQGFRVFEASTSDDADELTREQPLDLVIVDGLLPDASGVDWITRYRHREAEIPIIFMSAFLRDWDTFRQLTNELGVALVMYKPLDAQELAQKARDIVRRPASVNVRAVPPVSNNAVAEAIASLRRDFAERLPAKIEELATATRTAQEDSVGLSVARGLAHRIRGTAGSYGFGEVGEAAGRIEDLLGSVSDTGPAPSGFFWETLRAAVRDASLAAMHSGQPIPRIIDEGPPPPRRAVLVVHEDPKVLALAREAARQVAVVVLTAQTSAEALQLARYNSLIGALIDIPQDPDRDAFALARDLRQMRSHAGLAVAFTSRDQRIETRVAAIEAGGARFYDAPLTAEALTGLLQQLEAIAKPTTGCVLVVDDDPDALRYYALHLREAGIRVESALSPEAVFERLEKDSPDLVILDVNLPHVSGLDVCRAIRMSDRWEMTPVLVATARSDDETRIRAFRSGASDVLVKPIVADELLARVGVQLERLQLVRERSEKDVLSGLLLRRPFLDALNRATALASREQRPLAVTLLDLDHFKRINDEFGHSAGDAVIAGLGRLLRQRFRAEDLRGRWGGEEFVLAFPGQTAAIASQLVSRLLAEFCSLQFPSEAGHTLSASFSAGVAEFPADGTTIAALLKRADERLYHSKTTGRNRVSIRIPEHVPAPAGFAAASKGTVR